MGRAAVDPGVGGDEEAVDAGLEAAAEPRIEQEAEERKGTA